VTNKGKMAGDAKEGRWNGETSNTDRRFRTNLRENMGKGRRKGGDQRGGKASNYLRKKLFLTKRLFSLLKIHRIRESMGPSKGIGRKTEKKAEKGA